MAPNDMVIAGHKSGIHEIDESGFIRWRSSFMVSIQTVRSGMDMRRGEDWIWLSLLAAASQVTDAG
jgi:hypothetical protein